MPRLPLTDEQKAAVTSSASRTFIEAAPGAGKTTVAAERFGLLRFRRHASTHGAISALSFTRSATAELQRRVRSRWGTPALAWPHGVSTIDSLVCALVEQLLRRGIIRWPGGHTTIQVLDDWRGHRGYRWLQAGTNFRRVIAIDAAGGVTSVGRRVVGARAGIGSRQDFHAHLEAGRCTHEEIREVLAAVLRQPDWRQAVLEMLTASMAHLVVDEVFDANELDLAIVDLACEANVPVTLVGDPWQALYGFRGARPDLVPRVLTAWEFRSLPLSRSFRFQSPEMRLIGLALREGRPVSLAAGVEHDVVLASKWDLLWRGPDNVLPISFGRTANKTDAAAIVLLDHLVHSTFNQHAVFLPEALVLLELDPDAYRSDGSAILGGVVETLATHGPARALSALREAMRTLGAPRRPPAGAADPRQIERLTALVTRVRSDRKLIPGLTIHQAKGREWDRVGVLLTEAELGRVSAGLDREVEADRALYVALTRARLQVRRA